MKLIYSQKGFCVRLIYLLISVFWHCLTVGGRLNDKTRVVLCYHGIADQQRIAFREQMIYLKSFLAKKSSLSGNGIKGQSVLVTFDDAFANLLKNAVPSLQEMKIAAIIFAVPGNLGQPPRWNISVGHPEYNEKTMTAQQLKDIQNDLIEIGSHTQTHPDLSKLPADQVRWELTESKEYLEKLLDKPVQDLAFPHGAFNDEILHIAQQVGYKRIYTLEPKLVKHQDRGRIGRFSMSPDVWPIEFYLTCAGAYSWLYPFRKSLKKVFGKIVR